MQNDAKKRKMIETLAHGYSSESTQLELSNEYQCNRVLMVFKNLCILVLWTKVASALEGLSIIPVRWIKKPDTNLMLKRPLLARFVTKEMKRT